MRQKIKKRLWNIITNTVMGGLAAVLGWYVIVEPLQTSIRYEQEARESGLSVQERPRTEERGDVFDTNALYNGLKQNRYYNPVPTILD